MAFDPGFLLPDATALRLDTIAAEPTGALTIVVATIQSTAVCPTCHQSMTRVHSHYTRTVADLPWADRPIHLALHARKFFCTTVTCSRRIFTERLPAVVAPWGRRTLRLADRQRRIGITAGGTAGAALTTTLAMPVGDDTLLTLVRQTPLPDRPTPHVLGVDDWAMRKGQTYGTILVDLETGKPIDLLSERSADQFAHWLTDHPGVSIISRDRGGIYAEGAKKGAPDAVQVADRWHILKNLGDVLLRVFQQQHQAIEAAFTPSPPPPSAEHATQVIERDAATEPDSVQLTHREHEQQTRHAAKVARHEHVRQLHQQGVSLHAIARHTGLERKTVRKYVHLDHLPLPQARGQRDSLLDPYKPYILERWQAGCTNAMQLLREVQPLGYAGKRSILRGYLTQVRKTQGLPPRSRNSSGDEVREPVRKPPTWRTLTWLVLRRAERLSDEEQADVARVRSAHAELETAVSLAQDFAALVRERNVAGLEPWLARASASTVVPFRTFAKSIRQDEAAIQAALTLPWSNGPVEGHINRLKLLKRQAYGRSKLDLLRIRLLAA